MGQVILAILFKDIFQIGKSLIQKEDLDAAVRKVQEKSVCRKSLPTFGSQGNTEATGKQYS